MLFEMLAPFLVGKGKRHESLNKIESQVEFLWGLKDSRQMESWQEGLRFVDEWNYFDYCKSRWGWFGVMARLPLLKPKFACRIVHLEFL